MTLNGFDIYIRSESIPELPHQWGKFHLELISNRGTRIFPPPEPNIDLVPFYRCRYICNAEISDKEINEFIQHLTDKGFIWTLCQKLYQENGVDLYSKPY